MRKIFLIIIMCTALVLPGAAAGEKAAAITFDDGPSGRFTRRLLDGLEETGTKATFFLCGYRMEQYPDLTAEIAARGHEIGLHGYSHGCMGTMDPETLAEEIDKTASILRDLTGLRATLLRPPGGTFGDAVQKAAWERGLSIVTWSVDPKDWATDDTECIISRVSGQIEDGDIVLLHDMSDSSVDAALALADKLTARGFRLVTVSELLAMKEVKMIPGCIYHAGKPDW